MSLMKSLRWVRVRAAAVDHEWQNMRREKSYHEIRKVLYLLVELQPRRVALTVRILQAEKPNFAQADRLHHLIEQLLACRCWLDGELKFGVHRRHAHVHLDHSTIRCSLP